MVTKYHCFTSEITLGKIVGKNVFSIAYLFIFHRKTKKKPNVVCSSSYTYKIFFLTLLARSVASCVGLICVHLFYSALYLGESYKIWQKILWKDLAFSSNIISGTSVLLKYIKAGAHTYNSTGDNTLISVI